MNNDLISREARCGMTECEEKMCSDCKEKCEFYFKSINNGNIPFGCSVKKGERQ